MFQWTHPAHACTYVCTCTYTVAPIWLCTVHTPHLNDVEYRFNLQLKVLRDGWGTRCTDGSSRHTGVWHLQRTPVSDCGLCGVYKHMPQFYHQQNTRRCACITYINVGTRGARRTRGVCNLHIYVSWKSGVDAQSLEGHSQNMEKNPQNHHLSTQCTYVLGHLVPLYWRMCERFGQQADILELYTNSLFKQG